MRHVFLAGALAQEAVLHEVLGADARAVRVPARLEGAALWQERGAMGGFPRLYPAEGARCEGWLLSLGHDEGDETGADYARLFDRLAYLAEAFGMVPVPKHVTQGEITVAALTFLATGTPDAGARHVEAFDPTDWQSKWAAIARHASREILGYRDRFEAAALDWRMGMILTRAAARARAEAEPAPATLRSVSPSSAVELARSSTPHAGFFLTNRHWLIPPRFDGSKGEALRREVFVAADAALVLPYDPASDRVLLVEQFRMGPFGRGDPLPFVLEPVAGHVDAGETPEEAAHRETGEEAGISLRALEHISSHYCSPGCSTEMFHCYLGLADLPETGQGAGGLASENEDIRTHVIAFEHAERLMRTGEINIGPLVLMLLWLGRERARLRASA